jgi:hypothetical protein
LEFQDEPDKAGLRALAAREQKNRTARRMPALWNALKGMSRAGAAGAAGMDLHALRGLVVCYNAYRPRRIVAYLSAN